jgi:hypothetical protein
MVDAFDAEHDGILRQLYYAASTRYTVPHLAHLGFVDPGGSPHRWLTQEVFAAPRMPKVWSIHDQHRERLNNHIEEHPVTDTLVQEVLCSFALGLSELHPSKLFDESRVYAPGNCIVVVGFVQDQLQLMIFQFLIEACLLLGRE